MKQCLADNTSWRISLLEYLSIPLGPNIPSPSELMGRQSRGLLPLLQDHGAPESVQEHIMLQKEEKCRHDAVAHDLPVVPVGATVSYINKDLKTWSIGKVESREGRSYVVATEDGRLISCNRIHLRSTNVSFLPKSSRLDVPPATNLAQEANKCISFKPSNTKKSGQPATSPKPKSKQTPVSIPSKVELRTRSGRIIRKPPRYQE